MLNETFDVSCNVSTTSWVKSYGTEYQVGMYVCSGVENEMPLFNRIDSVLFEMTMLFFQLVKSQQCISMITSMHSILKRKQMSIS